MKYIDSNEFLINVNRVTGATELGSNGKVQSIVTIYKGESELTPVASNPIEGQFQLSIAKTTGCLAAIKNLNCVYATELTDQKGSIVLYINAEGKNTFVKNITLYKSISMDEVTTLGTRLKIAEQKITTEAITNTIKSEFYTKDQVKSQMAEMELTIDQWSVIISENGDEISALKLSQQEFEVKIDNKADTSNIITMINASTEGITISSDKVNITGFVTFSDLSSSGQTEINGDNITTGYISGDRIKGGIITATEEINFLGGARIFGNDGSFDAGLNISAAGFSFTGGSVNILGGSWYLTDGDFEVEGDITCSSLYSSGDIRGAGNIALSNAYVYAPNGTAYRDCLRLGSLLIQADSFGYLMTTSGGAYAAMAMARAEVTGDVICSNVWASNKVYSNNVALTSDKRLKTDIRYVDQDIQIIGDSGLMSPNVNITSKDMHEFIELLPLASYRMKDEVDADIDYTYYGFIAQDILYSKVGSELIEYGEVVIKETEYDKKGRPLISYKKEERLRYSENKFIAFLAGALKEEILQRKAMERKLDELLEVVNQITNS